MVESCASTMSASNVSVRPMPVAIAAWRKKPASEATITTTSAGAAKRGLQPGATTAANTAAPAASRMPIR
jgi:hypothetical protein